MPLLRECAFVLVIDHFHDEIQKILSELHSDHHSLFLFLKTAIEVHLSGKLNFSELNARKNSTVELQYSSRELEFYIQRLSNLPKLLDRNPVIMTDEIVELYLEVNVLIFFLETNYVDGLFNCSGLRSDCLFQMKRVW